MPDELSALARLIRKHKGSRTVTGLAEASGGRPGPAAWHRLANLRPGELVAPPTADTILDIAGGLSAISGERVTADDVFAAVAEDLGVDKEWLIANHQSILAARAAETLRQIDRMQP